MALNLTAQDFTAFQTMAKERKVAQAVVPLSYDHTCEAAALCLQRENPVAFSTTMPLTNTPETVIKVSGAPLEMRIPAVLENGIGRTVAEKTITTTYLLPTRIRDPSIIYVMTNNRAESVAHAREAVNRSIADRTTYDAQRETPDQRQFRRSDLTNFQLTFEGTNSESSSWTLPLPEQQQPPPRQSGHSAPSSRARRPAAPPPSGPPGDVPPPPENAQIVPLEQTLNWKKRLNQLLTMIMDYSENSATAQTMAQLIEFMVGPVLGDYTFKGPWNVLS